MNPQHRLLPMLGVLIFVAGCAAQGPNGPRRGADASPFPSAEQPKPITTGDRLADIALKMKGIPYRFGGATPEGFDCSGLVYYAYRQLGKTVPRTTADQHQAAQPVPRSTLARGDLLFFETSWKSGHVGIYVGGNRFIHAPSTGKQVEVVPLTEGYFASRLKAAGRLH